MSRSILVSTLVLGLLAITGSVSGQEKIAWMTNLKSAQEVAAREGKLVLVHFYSDNCPPCRALERNVFPRDEVAAAIHLNYVPVKVHVNTSPQLADHYRIEAWPTDLILTAAGLEVTRMISPKSAVEYQQALNQLAFQTGAGAGRREGSATFNSSQVRGEVALTAAAAPMQSRWGATGQSAGLAAAGTAPTGVTAYDPAAESNAKLAPPANAPPITNPYAVPQGPRGASRVANQATLAANSAPLASRASGAYQPPASRTSDVASSPGSAPAGRSIYDDSPPQQGASPEPTYSGPWSNSAPSPSQQSSVYDPSPMSTLVQSPAAQGRMVPQSPFPAGPPAQQASASFRSPRMVEITKAPPAAIDGFCPVTILESKRWHKGDVRFGAVHGGRTYLFASEIAQKKFLADPHRFSPVLSGCDPVVFAETNQQIDGNHNIGVLIGGRTYFFASEETRRRFELSPHVYIAKIQQKTGGSSPGR